MTGLTPQDRAVLNVAVLTWMQKQLKTGVDEARALADGLMKKGDTISARSPIDDTKIARVSKSDPKRRATVTNREALEWWITSRFPEKLVERTEITGPMHEVLQVLREHAAHLVTDRKSVPDWAVNELLVKAEKAGKPVGFDGELDDHAPPGICVDVPDGVVSVVLDKTNADAVMRELWDAHMIDMTGVRLIEGGATDGAQDT